MCSTMHTSFIRHYHILLVFCFIQQQSILKWQEVFELYARSQVNSNKSSLVLAFIEQLIKMFCRLLLGFIIALEGHILAVFANAYI